MSFGAPILQLVLDMRCNAACYLCGGYWPFRPRLTTQEAVDRLARAREMGICEVALSGGEVTLRTDLFELIHAAQSMGYRTIIIFTNGRRLADPDYAERLANSGITSIGSTLYGAESRIHETITRTRGSFQDTLDGIHLLRQRWPAIPLAINCVIAPENYQLLAATTQLLASMDVTSVQLTYIAPVGLARGIFLRGKMPPYQQVLPHTRAAVERYRLTSMGYSGRAISLAFFPLCVLGDLAPLSADTTQGETYFANESGELVTISSCLAAEHILAKRDECSLCVHNEQCGGVWDEYIARYGWNEFQPVLGECATLTD